MSSSFTHLHVHTEYSMLDGASRLDELVAAAAADGQPALGMTDHGNMYGTLDFYRACRAQGVKPIIGTEAYMAHESRHERPPRRGRVDDSGGEVDGGAKLYYHLILLAENNVGYKNLIQIASRAYMEGYYYKPRCLRAGQEIVTPDGMKRIEDLEVGDLVLTHKGRFRPVLQTMRRHHRGEIHGVVLNNRYSRITWMTGEHPVLVRDGAGNRRWVEARDLEAGRPGRSDGVHNWRSWACLPKVATDESVTEIDVAPHLTWTRAEGRPDTWQRVTERRTIGPTRHFAQLAETIKLDEDFGWFLGLYIAEGYATANEVRWATHLDERDAAERCAEMVRRLTGTPATVSTRADREDYRGLDVRASSTLLAQLLKSLCGTGAGAKVIPSFVWNAPESFQRAVLEGIFDGDGAYHDDCTIFTQTSERLAWQVRMLRASLHDDFASVERCELTDPNHADQYRSNYSPRTALSYRRTLADDDHVYRPIAEVVTEHYDGFVYNIEVAEDHSYVSDFTIHNCDWEVLEDHSEGVIATTGCLGGHVLQSLMRGDERDAIEKAARLQDIFGRDNLFVEIQDHGIPEQRRTNPQLMEIARRIGAPLLATNDSHYTHQHDHQAHDALLCVQTGSLMSDPDRFKFEGDQHYLKSAREMRSLFRDIEVACDNSLWIAERCDVEIEFGKPLLPDFPLPEGFADDDAYLEHLTFEGARKRWGDQLPDEVVERLAYELKVISDMGFSSYFLITWDLIKFARDRGIRVGPGRGSAAGCAVAYTLWITDLDPIKYDLLFERFLNPSRVSMPDIDMDFDSRYRDEMIRYAAERYGRDHVAQIVTFSQIKARAAVRDAARVLGYPYAVGDRVAKAMPPLVMGRDTPLYACLEEHPKFADGYKMAADLRAMVESDSDVAKVVEVAKGLEGLRRQDGIHAAAVVITKDPLTEYLPIQRKPEAGKPIEEAPVVTQYEMHGVEDLGLLKMDFLGLRNLDIIDDALELIEATTGDVIDIDNVDLADVATYELLSAGNSIGVFQLESAPMRNLMRSLAPDNFEDVAALVALYRPGPMAANMHNDYADRKNGRKPVEYIHPDAEELLGDTYGLMIYQESVMRMAQKFAGYSLAEADSLRKAMGKKIREAMEKERAKFVDGVVANGYERDLAVSLFDIIAQFADYAFNKSHSYGYGFIAYQIAYLKAHYPVQYLAALLTSVKSNLEKAAVYLNECRVMGIEVVVPDVNRARMDFHPEPSDAATEGLGTIVFGLSAIRNVGEGLVELLLAERDANGPFVDFFDFCERVDTQVLNKRTIEAMIKAGTFDSLGHPRQGLLMVFEQIIDQVVARRRERDMGIMTLFGDAEGGAVFDERIAIPAAEFDKSRRLANEKEMLGLYISDHPLLGVEAALRRRCDATIADAETLEDGAVRNIGGVVTGLQKKWTKKGELMAVFVLEDLVGSMEVMVFPRTMQEIGYKLEDDKVVMIRGRLDKRDDAPKLICMEVELFDADQASDAPPLRVRVPSSGLRPQLVAALKSLLAEHPGDSEVFIHLGAEKVIRLPDDFSVDPQRGLVAELRVLLGADAVLV
ncbi:MAG: DNA polymerase III subunit alpha [Acidimicrobiales bacterium]